MLNEYILTDIFFIWQKEGTTYSVLKYHEQWNTSEYRIIVQATRKKGSLIQTHHCSFHPRPSQMMQCLNKNQVLRLKKDSIENCEMKICRNTGKTSVRETICSCSENAESLPKHQLLVNKAKLQWYLKVNQNLHIWTKIEKLFWRNRYQSVLMKDCAIAVNNECDSANSSTYSSAVTVSLPTVSLCQLPRGHHSSVHNATNCHCYWGFKICDYQ